MTTLSSPRTKILQDGLKNRNVSRMLINLFQRWVQSVLEMWRLEKKKGAALRVHLGVWAELPLLPGALLIHVPESLAVVQHQGQRLDKAVMNLTLNRYLAAMPWSLPIEPTSYITFQASLTLWEMCTPEKVCVNLYFVM